MRRLSQSAFLAAVVLLAALPHLLADEAPRVQVQLDVTVLTCSAEVLAGCNLGQEGRAPARFGCLGASDRTALLEKVRSDKRTKLLAEPKVVCMNGRPASFMSGGQTPVPGTAGTRKTPAAVRREKTFPSKRSVPLEGVSTESAWYTGISISPTRAFNKSPRARR